MNTPNKITCFRIILVPFLVFFLLSLDGAKRSTHHKGECYHEYLLHMSDMFVFRTQNKANFHGKSIPICWYSGKYGKGRQQKTAPCKRRTMHSGRIWIIRTWERERTLFPGLWKQVRLSVPGACSTCQWRAAACLSLHPFHRRFHLRG